MLRVIALPGVITDLAGLLVFEILSGERTEAAYHGIVFA